MGVIVESPEFAPAEAGEHIATLKEVEDLGMMEDPFNEGQEKHRLKLVFELPGGATQFVWVTASLHPSAKLYEIASCLLHDNPPKKLDLDALIGMSCMVVIERFKNQKGKMASKIVDFRPAKSSPQVRKAQPQPEEKFVATDDDVPY